MISVNMEPDPDDLDYCENYVEGYPGVSYEETEECMEIRDQELVVDLLAQSVAYFAAER